MKVTKFIKVARFIKVVDTLVANLFTNSIV